MCVYTYIHKYTCTYTSCHESFMRAIDLHCFDYCGQIGGTLYLLIEYNFTRLDRKLKSK